MDKSNLTTAELVEKLEWIAGNMYFSKEMDEASRLAAVAERLESLEKALAESKERAQEMTAVKHGEWVHTDKHLWHKNEHGEIDEWVWESGFHNGPECEVCLATPCVNCEPAYQESTCRVGHYYCSQCGEVSKDAHEKFCPGCGAKMDGGKTDG